MIRGIQERTGGFTEFVLLPFVHASSPIYLAGLASARPTAGEPGRARGVPDHAARRDQLHPVLLGQARRGPVPEVLDGGVNDLGGTLMEETISRMAGSPNGSFKTISQLAELVAPTGLPLRQRTTDYGQPRRATGRRRGQRRVCASNPLAAGARRRCSARSAPARGGPRRCFPDERGSATKSAEGARRKARS